MNSVLRVGHVIVRFRSYSEQYSNLRSTSCGLLADGCWRGCADQVKNVQAAVGAAGGDALAIRRRGQRRGQAIAQLIFGDCHGGRRVPIEDLSILANRQQRAVLKILNQTQVMRMSDERNRGLGLRIVRIPQDHLLVQPSNGQSMPIR